MYLLSRSIAPNFEPILLIRGPNRNHGRNMNIGSEYVSVSDPLKTDLIYNWPRPLHSLTILV